MARLSEEEKEELKKIATSSNLRNELRKISENRYNPFMVNGKIDLDRLLEFLTEYNYFINHTPKPFRKILDRKNKI